MSWLKSWRGEWSSAHGTSSATHCARAEAVSSCRCCGLQPGTKRPHQCWSGCARPQEVSPLQFRWRSGDPGGSKIGVDFVVCCDEDVEHCATQGFLTIWLRNQGFQGPQVGRYLCTSTGMYIVRRCRHDARGGCGRLTTSRPRWNWAAEFTHHIQQWWAVGLIWTTLIWRKCSPNEFQYRADHEGDELAEARAWKLFALVPMMLFHRVQGTR